jgi:signal transduction histidine kinase
MKSTGIDAQLLAAALGELPIGIVVVGADGHLARATRLADELLEGDLAVLDRAWGDALAGQPRQGTLAIAGRTISFEARPIHARDGTIAGAVAMVQDVSARHLREQVEREFVANAAHELRTPLAAIAGAIEVLEHGAKELPAERDLFLSHIAQQSDRLQRVISALLTIARFDAGIEQPKLEVVPVRRVLAAVAASLVSAPDVRVSVRCRRDVAVLAKTDLLEEALANVAANAVRHTERGTIVLSCRTVGDRAAIVVQDTGSGVPTADRERVFERFYRAGSRDAQGFGLGLPIARHAIESMGGTVGLDAEEGKGTTVEIRLPLARLVREP